MAQRMQPVFGCRSLAQIPAAFCTAPSPRRCLLESLSTLPAPFGKTRLASPLGQASLHSLSALTTRGPSGTVRLPAFDFGLPI